MANIDYEKINKYLNDYCSEMDKSYFLENISDLYNLTLSLDFKLKTSVVTDRKARASLKEPTEYFTLIESLDLVDKYLTEKLPMYKKDFNKAMASGTLNIVDPDDDEATDLKNYAGIDEQGHHVINVVLAHDATDPNTIIHEFLHDMNSKEKEKGSRRYISEAISIYFELDMNNFMLEQGVSREDISSLLMYRLNDCYHCCEDILVAFPFLYYFYNLGQIDEKSYQNMLDFKLSPRPSDEKNFNEMLSDFQKIIERKPKYDPLRTFGYVIGTMVAFYGINQGEDFRQKMVELNDLANCGNVKNIFSHIGIDIYNENCIKQIDAGLDKGINIISTTINKRSSKEK